MIFARWMGGWDVPPLERTKSEGWRRRGGREDSGFTRSPFKHPHHSLQERTKSHRLSASRHASQLLKSAPAAAAAAAAGERTKRLASGTFSGRVLRSDRQGGGGQSDQGFGT